MSRGNGKAAVFHNDVDRRSFGQTLAEACANTDVAYCLMKTHFHLVVEAPRANLVSGMKWLLSTNTIRFNRRHKVFGHLLSGRYQALPVDGSGSGGLRTACDYVHLHPVRAKLRQPKNTKYKYQGPTLGRRPQRRIKKDRTMDIRKPVFRYTNSGSYIHS